MPQTDGVRRPRTLFAAVLVIFVGRDRLDGFAAEPEPPGKIVQWPEPQSMFDLLFGEPTEEEKRQLAKIPVSPQEELRVGNEVTEAYVRHLKQRGVRVLSRGRDAEYLRDLVESLRPKMRESQRYPRIKVYVAQSPECDARSLPGGTLVFFEGLLKSCDNEAALVGMVGHELSHLDRSHHLWRIRRMKLARKVFSGRVQSFSPREFMSSGVSVLRMWTRPFQPELEMEADRDGASWAYRTGYDPREMANLFSKLERQRHGVTMPDFLRSHPLPFDRHRALMQLYENLPGTQPRKDLYVGTENLRRRVARSRKEFPERAVP